MGAFRFRAWVFMQALVLLPVAAQQDLPDTPDLIRVTVDHDDNGVLIEWEPSQDPGVDLYYMYRMTDGTGTRIFVFSDSTYAYKHMTSGLENLAYSVTAVDTLDGTRINESLLGDNEHRAVATTLEYDPCAPSITVHWTAYVGWEDEQGNPEGKVSGYRVYGGPAGETPELLKFTHAKTRSYTHRNVERDRQYVYYVEAVHTSGMHSLSPIDTIRTEFPEPPEYLRMDQVSVLDRTNAELVFSADIGGAANGFRILRSAGPGMPFAEVETIWDPGQATTTYLDDTPTAISSYQYKVQALYRPQGCSEPAILMESNPGTSILLKGELDGRVAMLDWTPYIEYESGLSGYIIQRKNTEGEFIDIQAVGSGATSWSEPIEPGDGFQPGRIQYRVLAVSNPVAQGQAGISESNTLDINMESSFLVPDAFTPGSNDINALFRPQVDFTPRDYVLMVLDRNGRILFETRDPGEGWDGTAFGRGYVIEGVYVYHIRYSDFAGISRSLTGNVTVIFP